MTKQRFFISGLVALLLLTAIMFFVSVLVLSPTNSQSTQTQRFVVKRSESVNQIAERLTEAKLIKHPLVFRLVVWRNGLDKKIQAGSFELCPSMSVYQIAERLTQGVDDLWLTFPEGLRVEEMADLVSEQVGLDEFDKADFLDQAKVKEGYLFPDTYLVPKTIGATDLLILLTNTFEQKVEKGLAEQLTASPKSLAEIITMASLVQREAGSDEEEMAHIAGILWNRIAAGQGLAVDCTLQYLAGYNQELDSWWSPPAASLKTSNSQFNTYKFAGLPPTPIANPGLAAIKASLNPLTTDDFYYLHSEGKVYYAKTLAEHNANVQKYLK